MPDRSPRGMIRSRPGRRHVARGATIGLLAVLLGAPVPATFLAGPLADPLAVAQAADAPPARSITLRGTGTRLPM